MKYRSTRDEAETTDLSGALENGLAPDGGLYVPEELPEISVSDFESLDDIASIGKRMLSPFFEGDQLEKNLEKICEETFTFPVPLRRVDENLDILELFHGPTAAFKDVGARFLASCFSHFQDPGGEDITILVATSGDTGSAVASAFYQKPNTEVIILYPKDQVSDRQEKQLTCWDDNIQTFAVDGVFDDCQALVKEAFATDWWQQNKRLSSANSINIGRLLPQMSYYGSSSLKYWRERGTKPNYIVPSGNLGNVVACLYAREMGLPIGDVTLATNANRPVTHYLETGDWQTFETVETMANAMDVGNPSNMERLSDLWPEVETLRDKISAYRVTDEKISTTIESEFNNLGETWCPHTAAAVWVHRNHGSSQDIVAATAHPAKFDDVVEPLTGQQLELPSSIRKLIENASPVPKIAPTQDAFIDAARS
jgi:threonine synthase